MNFISDIDGQCVDIDECTSANENEASLCPLGHVCTNFIGGFRCHCPSGFKLNQHGGCEDVDECSRNAKIRRSAYPHHSVLVPFLT